MVGHGRGKWKANKWLTALMQGLIKQGLDTLPPLKDRQWSKHRELYKGWYFPWGKPGLRLRISVQLHPYRKHPCSSSGPYGSQSSCLDSSTEDCGSLSKPSLVALSPLHVIYRWAQYGPEAALQTSTTCSVNNKTACFPHTNVIPDSNPPAFPEPQGHGTMGLQSLRSVGLTAFRATVTMPYEPQNCMYTQLRNIQQYIRLVLRVSGFNNYTTNFN